MRLVYLLISIGITSVIVAAVGFSSSERSKLTLTSNKQLSPYLPLLAPARTKIRSDVPGFAFTSAVPGLAMSLRGGAVSPMFSGRKAWSCKRNHLEEVASDDDSEGIDLEALLQSVTADIEKISVDPQELADLGDFSGLGSLDFARDGEAGVESVFQPRGKVGEDSRRGEVERRRRVRWTENEEEDKEHGPSNSCIESCHRDKEGRGVVPAKKNPVRVCKGSGNDDAGVEEEERFLAGGWDGNAQDCAWPNDGGEEKEVGVGFSRKVGKDGEKGIREDAFEASGEARKSGVKEEEEDGENGGENEVLTVEESAPGEEHSEKGKPKNIEKEKGDEAGEEEGMLEGEEDDEADNEEEVVVNGRHYKEEGEDDDDEEGVEEDDREGEEDDKEVEEDNEEKEEENDEEEEAELDGYEDGGEDEEYLRFEVENDAGGQQDWDGREQSQVNEQEDDGGGEGITDELEEDEEEDEEGEWEGNNDEYSNESEIVEVWGNAAGIREQSKRERPQGMGVDMEDYDEEEKDDQGEGGGYEWDDDEQDEWDDEDQGEWDNEDQGEWDNEEKDEWDDEEKNEWDDEEDEWDDEEDEWDDEETRREEDKQVGGGAAEEEEEVVEAEEEVNEVVVEAKDQGAHKSKMANEEIGSASHEPLSRVEGTSLEESNGEWSTDGEGCQANDSPGKEGLVDEVSIDEADSEEENKPGTESERRITPTSSQSDVRTPNSSSEREAISNRAEDKHCGHSDGALPPRQAPREVRTLSCGRAKNALPEGTDAGVRRRRQRGELPRAVKAVTSDSRGKNRAERPTVVDESLASDEGDGNEAMVNEKVLGMEEWIDTQRRDPVPSKAPPRKTLDQVLEEGLGEIDDEDDAGDIARELREHRELGRRWVAGVTTSAGLGRTRKQIMKVLLLQATTNIIAGGGAPGTSPGRERLSLAGLAIGGGTIAVHRLLRRRIEATDFGDAADVETETRSSLGMLLRKQASIGRVPAKEHDLACLRSAARWGIVLFAVGAVFSLVLGVGEPFFVCAALGLSRFFTEPIFFVHAMGRGGGPAGARRPFPPPSILNSLLGSPHGMPGLDAEEAEDGEEARHRFRS